MWNFLDEIQSFWEQNSRGIVVVTGPTASGKTGVSLRIAECFENVEIINADSRQIYTDLPITTAVPTSEERKNIPHHLFEYISPEYAYNVSEWRDDLIATVKDIHSRKKKIILCGGTGLWIDAFTKNFSLGVAPDPAFREEMNKKSSSDLFQLLEGKDPESAKTLGPKNKKYIIRALEICRSKGKKTDVSKQNPAEYHFFMMGTTWKRPSLYDRINARTEKMFENGFLEEVQNFLQKYPDIPENDSAFIAHGIPEAIEYFNGEKTLLELKEKMKQHTRNYAKRQLTWWRKDTRISFIDMENGEKIDLKNPLY